MGPAARPRRRLLRKIVVIVVIGIIVGGAGLYWSWLREDQANDALLQEAIAEADRLDPGWRLEDLEARRRVPPAEENAATFVGLAGTKAITILNTGTVRADVVELQKPIARLAPNAPLTQSQAEGLRAQLTLLAPALAEGRKAAQLPEGFFKVNLSGNLLVISLYHVDQASVISWLLGMDASLRAYDGDVEGAWVSALAMFNTARAIGDEYLWGSQIARVLRLRTAALRTMERLLGHGELSEAALARTQKALEEDLSHPGLLITCRGVRSLDHQLFIDLQAGNVSLAKVRELMNDSFKEPDLRQQVGALFGKHEIKPSHAWLLRYLTEAVEIAKKPETERDAAFAALHATRVGAPDLARGFIPDFKRFVINFKDGDAALRCAVAALAVERYRLKQGRWPATLQEVKDAQLLRDLPVDPYDGKPLRYRSIKDGVVVHSIGPVGQEKGDALEQPEHFREDHYWEFRLWDVDKRAK